MSMTWRLNGERRASFAVPTDGGALKYLTKKAFGFFGLKISRIEAELEPLNVVEASQRDLQIMNEVRPYTMTSPLRIWALVNAIQYISVNRIEGDICESGVWRGGSIMAAALKLMSAGDFRNLWLYDTFGGMTEPIECDKAIANGAPAYEEWKKYQRGSALNEWCFASLDDVRRNVTSTGYPMELVRFVAGKVEETLSAPSNIPGKIALLRLDTDWYESTKAELEALYDRLSPGGVVIIDDYGYWEGQRRAVDAFFASRPRKPLLGRIDSIGRIGVKIA
jgi:hypothetical protein